MLNECALTALREIAYGENSIPKDRISACSALFKNDVDISQIKTVLEYVIQEPATKDKDRVGASTLLLTIDSKINSEKREDIDEAVVSQALTQQYVRFG